MAAGADAILERAEQRLNQGEYLSCIRLAEIVLSEKESERAMDLFARAHKALLDDENENFWLKGWLQHQLNTIETQY